MGLAQFGPYRSNGLLTSAIRVPEWPKQPIEDDYITPKIVPGATWTPKDYPF